MEKNRKLGWLLMGVLMLGTLGAHAAYRAHNLGAKMAQTNVASQQELVPIAQRAWEGFDAKNGGAPQGPDDSTNRAAAESRDPADSPSMSMAHEPNRASEQAPASGPVRLEGAVDRTAVLLGGDGVVHVGATIDTRGIEAKHHVPSDVIVVLDRSGSMGGQKLAYGKQALRELIDRLGDDDRLSLITYDQTAEVRVPLGTTARGQRASWRRVVDMLEPGGSTNMSAGLDLGLAELERGRRKGRSSRFLLLSDGLANEGDTTQAGLSFRAQRATRMDAVLGTVGIGADFDERIMTMLARAGTGAFYYLAKLEVLPTLLNAELKTAAETYAQSGVLRLKAQPGVTVTSASTGVVYAKDGNFEVPVGAVYGGQTRTIWLTLKVPTGRLDSTELGALSFEYRRDGEASRVQAANLPKIACLADEPEFRRHIVEKVWEQALLDEDMNRSREALSDAIRSGVPAEVDKALAWSSADRKLAAELGNQRVQAEFRNLDTSAESARTAQKAPMPARAHAAKSSAAEGFGRRNQGAYQNFQYDSAY